MSDNAASLARPPEAHGEWLADLIGRIKNARATALSWRMNHSD